MGKQIVPVLGLIVIAAGAWLLLSKSDPATDGPTVRRTPTRADGPATPASGAAPDSAAAPATRARRPVVRNALPKRPTPAPAKVDRDRAAEVDPAVDPQTAAGEGNRPMRQPKAQMTEVQATVRQFYGNLPKSGKLPARVTIEEVLPRGIIDDLGASPQAQITMLGPWPIQDVRGFKEVLEFDPRYDTMLGVTWKRPDGTDARDYISLKAPQSPEPSP